MSASLVGSEMCIRDRCSALVGAPRRRLLWDPAVSIDACGTDVLVHESVAVSYTHLTLPTICSV
eukprot:13078221-Alexandrium_andersonii.AAC.1